jgi:phosphatidylserine/phosphatidylglycerophosphate/cardiolipin synthase-like enzyme
VISTRFLRDTRFGGSNDQLSNVAAALAAFVHAAASSIDVAIYDFRLAQADAAAAVVDALATTADRGVPVRIAYDAGKPTNGTRLDFAALEADPAPVGTADWLAQHFAGTQVQTRAIATHGQLMHSKYLVRDAVGSNTDAAAIWTGSTNFTDDAWTFQENNIITLDSSALVTAYRTDFDQLWTTGAITGTGRGDRGSTTAGGGTLGWDFCPGDGSVVNSALASRVRQATNRLIVAAMVLTSREVLAALAAATRRGIPLTGIYDGGQMDPIVKQWQQTPTDATVLGDWQTVSGYLKRKHSTPYTPTSLHDFMHLKVLVADDTVVTGSYNFSANAERNAENQIFLNDPHTVDAYVKYLEAVLQAYS